MNSLKTLTFLFLLSFTFTNCNKENTNPDKSKQRIIINIEDEYTSSPSKVSVFFKVEYGDGTPVSDLTENNFTLYEQGRNDEKFKIISADEADRIIGDNAPVFSYSTILLLDLSGSVLNGSLAELKTAATQFINKALSNENSNTQVGIWWFDGADKIHRLSNFSREKQQLITAVNSIDASLSRDRSTDLFGAVMKGVDLAEAQLSLSENEGVLASASVIVFTDGTDQAARYARQDAFDKVNKASKGINYYTIGLGSEIDETVLKKIGKTSSVFANNTTRLTEKFTEIANLISSEANSYYLFQYCTPKRDGSGISKLRIEIENQKAKGTKDTNFDATGFTSGTCALN